MNNTTTSRYLTTIVAIFMAATLVVGIGTLATTTTTNAFAYLQKKKPVHDGNNKDKTGDSWSGSRSSSRSESGNTDTRQKDKQDLTQSGFDSTGEQEGKNLICTNPNDNCIQGPPTLRIIKRVVCQPTDPNCSLPATCIIGLQTTSQKPQAFTCQSAVGNGLLFTLQPGDNFFVGEGQTEPGPIFDVSMSGDCSGTIAAGQHLTCTITNTEQGPG